ncbi:hypothetical protein Tsubulata_013318 [Turnera subulata]|uniref:HTH myb-type domain-containing protein n=1 Tax=Turnera subulata TaxID=218843 RepID=A0A9Q0JF77_9ROSI|nr:hypothetical protein Tsubulata_035765 [Turnera subulata]KAJ4843406.1 hypothetical protein Tsubulata_013318 [Turnera subulata]
MRKPCCDKEDMNKGAWTKQEDQILIDFIQKNGEGCWRTLPQAAGLLRCGKSCRLRWINYLRPDLKRGKFEEDEEDLIIKLHALLGNRNTEQEMEKICTHVDNEQKSEAGSCLLEDGPSSRLPDLNLDLTISNPSLSIAAIEEKIRDSTHEPCVSRELKLVSSPTLLLFQ